MMFYGIFGSDVNASSGENLVKMTKVVILSYWFVSIMAKAYVHYRAYVDGFVVKGREDPRDMITRVRDWFKEKQD